MTDKCTKIDHDCCRSACPITATLDIIGDKWTLLIIRDMLFFESKCFNDFINASESISTNILTDRLKKLEKFGIIEKQAYQEKPTRYAYSLTDAGKSLQPMILELMSWGREHIEGVSTTPPKEVEDFLKRCK
ncbi:MAG: winged helix-turn-helix transcriptional regulator [Alphaproteobacteria bacterium]